MDWARVGAGVGTGHRARPSPRSAGWGKFSPNVLPELVSIAARVHVPARPLAHRDGYEGRANPVGGGKNLPESMLPPSWGVNGLVVVPLS
jgi:hypothetical protein